jgi:hypothetical protein
VLVAFIVTFVITFVLAIAIALVIVTAYSEMDTHMYRGAFFGHGGPSYRLYAKRAPIQKVRPAKSAGDMYG